MIFSWLALLLSRLIEIRRVSDYYSRQCSRAWPGKAGDAPLGLIKAYLEQWLNGLVYELFFPGELHARKLNLFDETAR